MNQKWDQFDGDTKVGRLADLVTGFNALPATALLDAIQDSEYKSCKADLERLFRDIQLHSSPPNLASVHSSIGREVPAPSKVPELTSESFVLPSSVKAVEKRLAMSESGSTTSFQRPRTQSSRAPLPHQSSLSWGSEATPEEAPSFPSSASTKRGDAARSGPLRARLPGGDLTDTARVVPLLSKLLRLRHRGDRTLRCDAWRLDGGAPDRAVSSVPPRRLRPRPIAIRLSRTLHG